MAHKRAKKLRATYFSTAWENVLLHEVLPKNSNSLLKDMVSILKSSHPHSFRHRYAKNFLEAFNDISLLADLMGHESIETTRIYLRRNSLRTAGYCR